MALPPDQILNHELLRITKSQCNLCHNFKHLKILDKDINENLINNYCKIDKHLLDKITLKKITNKGQRIHVLGNHWPLINSLKHRKFSFYSKQIASKNTNKDSICVTDTTLCVNKTNNQLIITQGYSQDYNLSSVDYLLIEKKHIELLKGIDETFNIPFNQQIISDKGFLVIDLNNDEVFYTE